MKKPIACEIHDYFETACVYQYELKITLKDQSIILGIARTTRSRNHCEYLVIEADGGEQEIELNNIALVKVLTKNAKFEEINVSSSIGY